MFVAQFRHPDNDLALRNLWLRDLARYADWLRNWLLRNQGNWLSDIVATHPRAYRMKDVYRNDRRFKQIRRLGSPSASTMPFARAFRFVRPHVDCAIPSQQIKLAPCNLWLRDLARYTDWLRNRLLRNQGNWLPAGGMRFCQVRPIPATANLEGGQKGCRWGSGKEAY